jgi:hypothetical protein
VAIMLARQGPRALDVLRARVPPPPPVEKEKPSLSQGTRFKKQKPSLPSIRLDE